VAERRLGREALGPCTGQMARLRRLARVDHVGG
jgi:hypothetical protein